MKSKPTVSFWLQIAGRMDWIRNHLRINTYNYLLLHVVTCCYMLLHVVTCCYMLLHVVTCCYMLLQGVHLLEKCWKNWTNWENGLFLKTCWKNWNLIAFSPCLAGIAGKISFFIPFLFFQCYVFMLF